MDEIKKIPQEKFEMVQGDAKIFDAKFETKPIGYFKDAWIRFKKNKASVTATYIIGLVILFGVITPFFSHYDLAYSDAVYAKVRPKLLMFEGSGFWDGSKSAKYNDRFFIYSVALGYGLKNGEGEIPVSWEDAVKASSIISYGEEFSDDRNTYRYVNIDSYKNVGFIFTAVTREKYDDIRAWEKETGIQVLYPLIDFKSDYAPQYEDANMWYRVASDRRETPVDKNGNKMTLAEIKEKGLIDNYLRDKNGSVVYTTPKGSTMLGVRVLYYNYYQFLNNGWIPRNAFGTDAQGFDIMVRLAHGVRLSLALAICVSLINFVLGAIYGSITGFYGGWIDLIFERIKDVLGSMPFIIIATLFQLHLVQPGKVSVFTGLLFAFVLTGWIAIGGTVRTQFYRFKNQEYILAAKTLGARDARLMFKHIFPNAIGTVITRFALIIPGTILTESTLSFLGIVSFHGKDMASIGTMLGTARNYLSTDPHMLFFPAATISLMMISFNLFGNGLRDAFNPSLRGVDD